MKRPSEIKAIWACPLPACCLICGVLLDQPGKLDTGNCGGDCVRCMAVAGDPDLIEVMHKLEPENPQWQSNL